MIVLLLCTAVGCGVVAGVFFAFSTFVMAALARLPVEQGVAAMQAVNVTAINRWFMTALFGTAAACLLLAAGPLLGLRAPSPRLVVPGTLVYLLGVVGVTIAFNVPRNDALAAVQAGSAEAGALWPRFLAGWTAWNHVRTLAGIAATALLVAALTVRE